MMINIETAGDKRSGFHAFIVYVNYSNSSPNIQAHRFLTGRWFFYTASRKWGTPYYANAVTSCKWDC